MKNIPFKVFFFLLSSSKIYSTVVRFLLPSDSFTSPTIHNAFLSFGESSTFKVNQENSEALDMIIKEMKKKRGESHEKIRKTTTELQ